MMKYGNSSYWLGDDTDSRYYDPLTGEFNKPKGKDLIQLSSYRRAIANFVSIVTGQNVPVMFKHRDSYTDGKSVVLAGNLTDKNFDVAVGLALHEGSHIKLTDFASKPRIVERAEYDTALRALAETKGVTISALREAASGLLNIVEDRRIDKFVQTSAPGYRGYYSSMYDHYFNDKMIDKALLTKQMTEETLDNYMFHICNFINPNRQLDDLVGLREIWNIFQLGNIGRLKSSADAEAVAYLILEKIIEVLPEVPEQEEQEEQQSPQNGDGNGEGESNENENGEGEEQEQTTNNGSGGEDNNSDDDQDLDDNGEGSEGSETETESSAGTGGGVGSGNGPTEELSDRQKKQLEKAIKKQKEFVEGNIEKRNLTKKDVKQLDAIDSSKTSIESVDYTKEDWYGGKHEAKIDVVVIKELNEAALEGPASMFTGYYRREDVVADGMRLGKMLGKKLQVRNDDNTTIYNRQKRGKIDRRLLADLGVGNNKIFEQTFVTKSSEADIHISIDASGSMNGTRWKTAVTTAIAIAKAADIVGGVDVRIDMRATSGSELTNYKEKPTVLIAYDSTRHSMNHIKKYFDKLTPGGTTPEGICFKAISDVINTNNKGKDRYFINLSDGSPDYESYEKVTRDEVKKMKASGMRVLSYFIDGYNMDRFNKMYGADSSAAIETANLMQIAKTMNKLLSEKK